MPSLKRLAPILQLILILPAAVFMLALILRPLGAPVAAEVVKWYSGRFWTLWLLLSLLPLAVFVIGCLSLWSHWREGATPRPDRAWPLVLALTVLAAVILVVVGAHVLMD